MVLVLPLKADALSQHVEEERIWGEMGDCITQDAEETRFTPHMNDAVKCIL